MADEYSRRQSKHATKIASERALMDMLGLSRSQARRLNEGLDNAARRFDARPREVLGPPAPPQIQVSEAKTEKRGGIVGLDNAVPAAANNGGNGAVTLPGTITLQALVHDGSTVSAALVEVYGSVPL